VRTLTEPLTDGVAAGVGLTADELDAMTTDYYAARGWDANGRVNLAAIGS
jgi:aldehyde:ferredoxin oxidoreductase